LILQKKWTGYEKKSANGHDQPMLTVCNEECLLSLIGRWLDQPTCIVAGALNFVVKALKKNTLPADSDALRLTWMMHTNGAVRD